MPKSKYSLTIISGDGNSESIYASSQSPYSLTWLGTSGATANGYQLQYDSDCMFILLTPMEITPITVN